MHVAVAMRVTTILMVVAAAARPVYVAVLSLPVIVAAARTMLVAVLSVRVLVAVLVLGLRHVRRVARGVRRRVRPRDGVLTRPGRAEGAKDPSVEWTGKRGENRRTTRTAVEARSIDGARCALGRLVAPNLDQFPFPRPARHLHGCARASGFWRCLAAPHARERLRILLAPVVTAHICEPGC